LLGLSMRAYRSALAALIFFPVFIGAESAVGTNRSSTGSAGAVGTERVEIISRSSRGG
jgi:hypothetical protein